MRRAIIGLLSLALLAGCWARHRAEVFTDPGFAGLNIRTIAVMPIFNQTQAALAPDAVMTSVVHQLRHTKKYAVIPPAKVAQVLNRGGSGAFAQMVNRVSMGEKVPLSLLERMARDLEADALFIETVLSFHEVPEQGPGVSAQGGIYYQTYDVSVVGVEAELYSTAARDVVWRNQAFERTYRDAHRAGRTFTSVVQLATSQLLSSFPENTWAPVEPPRPAPVPSPVTSYVPFPEPRP